MVVTLVSWASLSITTVARSLSAGIIIRLVSLRSSLRALDSAGGRLMLGNVVLMRIPTTWVCLVFERESLVGDFRKRTLSDATQQDKLLQQGVSATYVQYNYIQLYRYYSHTYLHAQDTHTYIHKCPCIYHYDMYVFIYIPYDIMCAGTQVPNVTLARSSLNSLLIRWSVSSTEYLNNINYTVYWSGPYAETCKNNSTVYNNYTIKGLRSNSPYNVTVEAFDSLGKQNSTNQLYFTSPTGKIVCISFMI